MEKRKSGKICKKCGKEKDIEAYRKTYDKRDGKNYYRSVCRKCDIERVTNYVKTHHAFAIFQYSRKGARRKNQVFELTKEDVEKLVSLPCSYCGSYNKIGIDRKENSIGYTINNSVPCCPRCNMMKRDMPLVAWLAMTPVIREIFETGLFGDWVGHNTGKTHGKD
jgi:hypothetical protein